MDDVTKADFDKLSSSITNMTGTLGLMTKKIEEARKDSLRTKIKKGHAAVRGHSQNLDKQVRNVERNLEHLTGSLRDVTSNLRLMMRDVFGGAIVGLVLEKGAKMARTFTDLNEVGQNFGGSMENMYKAAAAAGLPLSDFAELVKKNGEVMAKMGTQDFAKMALGVRQITEKQGLYGYSVEQLNEQLGEYMKTSAMYGTAGIKQSQSTMNSFAGLAAETSELSEVTKKSRTEIAQLANEAMRGALAIGGMMQADQNSRVSLQKSLTTVTTVFAAQQGEAGRMLSKFAADTFGAGTSALTEGGKLLYEKGLGDVASDMDVLSEKIKNNTATQEDAFAYNNKFMKAIDQNAQMLTMLASSGDAGATQLLEMRSHMKEYTAKDIADAKKSVTQRAAITTIFQSIESRLGIILGHVTTGFLKGADHFIQSFSKAAEQINFQKIEDNAQRFGEWFGSVLPKIFSQANTDRIVGAISDLARLGPTLVNIISGLVSYTTALAPVLPILSGLVYGLISVSKLFGEILAFGPKLFGASEQTQSAIRGVGTALTLYFGPKIIKSMVKGFLSSATLDRKIIANNVFVEGRNVNGGGGGGLGLGGGSTKAEAEALAKSEAAGAKKGFLKNLMERFHPRNLKAGIMEAGKTGGKGLLAAAVIAGVGFGASRLLGASPASAATLDEKPTSTSRAAPMRVLHADMISNAGDQARYRSLLEQRLKLSHGEVTDESKKQLDSVNAQLATMNDKYGTAVNDPHDYNYVRLHGQLPAGHIAALSAKLGAKSFPKPASKADTSKGGLSKLDMLQMGLAGASFMSGPIGSLAGVSNAVIDGVQGHWGEAGLGLLSAIPILGDAAAASKMARIASKAGKIGRLGQSGMITAGIGSALGIGSLFGANKDTPANDPGATLDQPAADPATPLTASDPTVDALNKLIAISTEQGQTIQMLLMQLNQVQEQNNTILTKVLQKRA